MARTAKKAKAVTTTTVEDVATDENVISIGDVSADVIAALPAPESIAAEAGGGVEILIPLDRLKKSPRNARKTPHSNETVETYAASIAAKGILQNLVLERLQGTDPQGFSGLEDEVDYHWGQLFKAAALSTLLGVGTQIGSDDEESEIAQAIRASAVGTASNVGQQIVSRQLNIQPTLTVRPGFPVRVIVNRDLVMQAYGVAKEPT